MNIFALGSLEIACWLPCLTTGKGEGGAKIFKNVGCCWGTTPTCHRLAVGSAAAASWAVWPTFAVSAPEMAVGVPDTVAGAPPLGGGPGGGGGAPGIATCATCVGGPPDTAIGSGDIDEASAAVGFAVPCA